MANVIQTSLGIPTAFGAGSTMAKQSYARVTPERGKQIALEQLANSGIKIPRTAGD